MKKSRTGEKVRRYTSYSIPRAIPRVVEYRITFLAPINVRKPGTQGWALIDPALLSHTYAHLVGDWLIFLYRGRRYGLPEAEFRKHSDGSRVRIEHWLNPHVEAFIEKKKKQSKFPKHLPQNPWEISSGPFFGSVERLRHSQSLSHQL